jgi:hypothetical protein
LSTDLGRCLGSCPRRSGHPVRSRSAPDVRAHRLARTHECPGGGAPARTPTQASPAARLQRSGLPKRSHGHHAEVASGHVHIGVHVACGHVHRPDSTPVASHRRAMSVRKPDVAGGSPTHSARGGAVRQVVDHPAPESVCCANTRVEARSCGIAGGQDGGRRPVGGRDGHDRRIRGPPPERLVMVVGIGFAALLVGAHQVARMAVAPGRRRAPRTTSGVTTRSVLEGRHVASSHARRHSDSFKPADRRASRPRGPCAAFAAGAHGRRLPGTTKPRRSGLMEEPSSGLEPETPSLPCALAEGTGGRPRVPRGVECPAKTRWRCTRGCPDTPARGTADVPVSFP